jgi:FkbM family methyltransferase
VKSHALNLSQLRDFARRFGALNTLRFLKAEVCRDDHFHVMLEGRREFTSNLDRFTFQHMAYSWPKIEKLVSKLPREEDCLVLDVGANIGMFTVLAQQWNPHAEIHAFEPSPIAAKLLRQNVGPDVRVNELCAGNADSDITFYELVDGLQASTAIAETVQIFGNTRTNIVQVPCIRLDNYLDRLGSSGRTLVVKIDVQGYEQKVIEGLGKYLEQVRCLCLESTWFDIDSIAVALELVRRSKRFEVVNDVQFGADLFLEF